MFKSTDFPEYAAHMLALDSELVKGWGWILAPRPCWGNVLTLSLTLLLMEEINLKKPTELANSY